MHYASGKIFALALVALSIAGCGLKGPLYRPEDKPQTSAPSTGETESTQSKRRTTPQSQTEDSKTPTPPPGR